MMTPLSRILPWRKYYRTHRVIPDIEGQKAEPGAADPILNEKVSVWKGDITKLSEIDAIVNSTNRFLRGGGTGVNAAVHRAAGRKLAEECSALQGCVTGEAKITKGYDLPAKHVIHTVNSFALMLRHNLRSIAFPCIGTGGYGFDTEQAAHLALYETNEFLDKHHSKVERIVFCVFSKRDLRMYEMLMQRWFAVWEPLEFDMTTLDEWSRTTNNSIAIPDVKREEFGRWRRPIDLK